MVNGWDTLTPTPSGSRRRRWWGRGAAIIGAAVAFLLVSTPAVEAACYTTVKRQVPVEKVRYVYPTYQVPVYEPKVTYEWKWKIVDYETHIAFTPRIVESIVEEPVYGTMYTHYNYWDDGWVSSCSGYGYIASCGEHGDGWIDHETIYFDYVAYYQQRLVATTVYDKSVTRIPIYGYKLEPVTTYVKRWETRKATKPVPETYTAYEMRNFTVEVACPTKTTPSPTPSPLPTSSPRPTPTTSPTAPAATIYTLYYDANGGTGTIAPVKGPNGTRVKLASGGVTRAGYILSGWTDGKATFTPGATYTLTGNVTMRAVWTVTGELRPS